MRNHSEETMRWCIGLVLLASTTACSGDPLVAWAFDPVYLEPTEDSGVYGIQTWEFYSRRWTRSYAKKHYLCAVVVELEGTPSTELCDRCEQAWDVSASFLESDCASYITDEEAAWLAVTRVGIGTVGPELVEAPPHPGSTSAGFVDYGTGQWETHGWAYAAALDNGGSGAVEWDDAEPFQLWPAFVWDLDLD
jgi:hypothetical protein